MRKSNLRSYLQHTPANILLLSLLPIANLLFIHYFFYFESLLELTFMYISIANFISVVFDVFVLIFFIIGVR